MAIHLNTDNITRVKAHTLLIIDKGDVGVDAIQGFAEREIWPGWAGGGGNTEEPAELPGRPAAVLAAGQGRGKQSPQHRLVIAFEDLAVSTPPCLNLPPLLLFHELDIAAAPCPPCEEQHERGQAD